MSKTILLLDVDGPLNPWSARKGLPEGFTEHETSPEGWDPNLGLTVRLRASDGPRLMATGCELIWATAWEDEANIWIGPNIGLPELPFIPWEDRNPWNIERLHWKTKKLVAWMDMNRPGIPFKWIDDEVTRRDRDWVEETCAPGSGIMLVSPKFGLEEGHFETIEEWKSEIDSRNL